MSNEIATIQNNLPAYLAGYKGPTGAEGIDTEDVTIPRIEIAQSLTDEVKNGDIDDGDIFLNVTKEVLATSGIGLRFVVVAQSKEIILWRPRKNGGGILARAHPVSTPQGKRYAWDKPNQSFDVKVDGKTPVTWHTKTYVDEDGLNQWGTEVPGNQDSGPAATEHHNYVVVLPDHDDMVAAISLSRTKAKRAKDFNAMLKMGNAPVQARVFSMKTETERSDSGEYKNVRIQPDGFVSEEQFNKYRALAETFKVNNFKVDQSGGDEAVDQRV